MDRLTSNLEGLFSGILSSSHLLSLLSCSLLCETPSLLGFFIYKGFGSTVVASRCIDQLRLSPLPRSSSASRVSYSLVAVLDL